MATTYAFPTTTSPTSESSELQNHSVAHSRNLSTVSSVTLHANTSLHSTPHEPLLPPISQGSLGACDVISYHSRLSPVISPPRWSQNNLKQSFLRDEKIKSTDSTTQRQSKRLRWVKIGLETAMGMYCSILVLYYIYLPFIVVWSLYTMIRYLYAFTIYDSLNGQLAAFGLGILAGLSFAFTCCSIILSAVNKHLLGRGVFVKSLSSVHSVLQYPPSLCFLFPAIANFVLLLVWRNISTLDLNLHHRCKVDVDLVWTITYSRCDNLGQPWGVWIALAFIRVVLSFLIIVSASSVSLEFDLDKTDRLRFTMSNPRKSFLCQNSPMPEPQYVRDPCLPNIPVKFFQRNSPPLTAKSLPYITDRRNTVHHWSSRRNTSCDLLHHIHLEILTVLRVITTQISSQYRTPLRTSPPSWNVSAVLSP